MQHPLRLCLAMTALVLAASPALHAQRSLPRVEVLAEEDVFVFQYPNNGAGPLWCYGSTQIVREGDDVYVSEQQTNRDVEPYCNTRWRLLRRTGEKRWETLAEEDGFRQREPCPLGRCRETLFMYVNDSLTAPGTKGDICKPYIRKFDLGMLPITTRLLEPEWSGNPHFTDHSYRGFAVDRYTGELLMLNTGRRTVKGTDKRVKGQNWCWMNNEGMTLNEGIIEFPLFAAYPQAALAGGGAHMMAISDVPEPNETWRAFKKEKTGHRWDFVFRELYYSSTSSTRKRPFSEPLVVAEVHETGGHISNQDLWLSPERAAYVLYTEREVQSALLRDEFFPGKSILNSLKLAVVKNGKIVERRDLLVGTEARDPQHARFHETPDGKVYAVIYTAGTARANWLMQVHPRLENPPLVPIPFRSAFSRFCLASVRAGNEPSYTVDLFGDNQGGYAANFTDDRPLTYAQVRITE